MTCNHKRKPPIDIFEHLQRTTSPEEFKELCDSFFWFVGIVLVTGGVVGAIVTWMATH